MPDAQRGLAEQLDAADPLAHLRERFVDLPDEVIYLDGNSLGRPPAATLDRLDLEVRSVWARELVGAWEHWLDLPTDVGDLLGTTLLGARPGETVVADTTSINLYKLAWAAVAARPGRGTVVTSADNFPTDHYVLQGICAHQGLQLVTVPAAAEGGPDLGALERAIGPDVALVSLSLVDYRLGALTDMRTVNAQAHASGALVLWDLSHAAGAVPLALAADGADLAVGCTYKYLNAGPGAPAFLWVRGDLHATLTQPIWGWFGQRDQFAMATEYEPEPGIRRFMVSSPPVVLLRAVEAGVELLGEAGMERLRAKSLALTGMLIDLADAWLRELGFEVVTPRPEARRGGHVALRHADARRIGRALIEKAAVIPDFRGPDILRLAPVPIATRFVDVYDALARLRDLVRNGEHLDVEVTGRVT
ncbi:MAG: kynureninase [Acidimicrobiales bacterium]|nr:kynureninase [Acidimicrobiales bacterium]